MTEPAARPRRRWKFLLIFLRAALLFGLAALWYINTQSFQSYVRGRLVAEVERITGGRAEIGSFHVVPFHFRLKCGTSRCMAQSLLPIFRLPWNTLLAQLKVISLLRTEFGFNTVMLDHPIVHISIAPDGTTNIPGLKVQTPVPVGARVDQLFALSIDHLSVRNGELVWGDRSIPLDFSVQGTALQMDYAFLRSRYDGHLKIGKADTNFSTFRPFSWMTSTDFSLGSNFVDLSSLTWNSGRSSFKANGRINDFRNPHFTGNYDAQIDVEEAAAIARSTDLRRGVSAIQGQRRMVARTFTTSGALALRDLTWEGDQREQLRTPPFPATTRLMISN